MTPPRMAWVEGAGWGVSALVHAGALVALATGVVHSPNKSFAPSRVSFDVVAAKAAPLTPSPTPVKPAARMDRPAPRAEPVPTPPPPLNRPIPEPVDLTGVTLTGAGNGATWSSVVGNGARMDGAIQVAARTYAPAPIAPSGEPAIARPRPAPTAREPAMLPLADLSRRPVPPKLDRELKGHYPTEARQRGVSGRAIVRARVEADGMVRLARVAFESFTGFGAACQRTVVGSKWLPPLDREGRPVATEVTYACRFEVER